MDVGERGEQHAAAAVDGLRSVCLHLGTDRRDPPTADEHVDGVAARFTRLGPHVAQQEVSHSSLPASNG